MCYNLPANLAKRIVIVYDDKRNHEGRICHCGFWKKYSGVINNVVKK